MSNNNKNFPCFSCGKCCQRVGLSEQTKYLDRGDLTCQYFEDNTKLCTVYETRPLICQVENYYNQNLSHIYSWDQFIAINLKICESFNKK